MTNSMIPYSFIPGTKAKAGEVNANFIALANFIEQNKTTAKTDIDEIKESMKDKADKQELIHNHTINEAGTNLDDYKTPGAYVFTDSCTPSNTPRGTSGILIVTGCKDTMLKQIWLCNRENNMMFSRTYTDSTWRDWLCTLGIVKMDAPGYVKLANGLLIQWGRGMGKTVTYPMAFPRVAAPVCMKFGYNASFERSDTGFTSATLTGFTISTAGYFTSSYWIAIGY